MLLVSLHTVFSVPAVNYKQLSYRRETELQSGSVFLPKIEDDSANIIWSIFNHCDAIGPQSSNSVKTQNKG